MAEKITVGEFSIENGELSGPADYMNEKGNARLDSILAGDDPIFNATAHFSPTIETAILVNLQTDWAGWKGTRDFMRQHRI